MAEDSRDNVKVPKEVYGLKGACSIWRNVFGKAVSERKEDMLYKI
jgi:hypothetical protein